MDQDSHCEIQIVSGAEMIVRGAIDAGVRFYAGYPITPASGIYAGMMAALPGHGGVAVGASDEISALSYCVGASLRGAKAMTATSGPGFSLMAETIGYALMTETPVVIVLAQRLGPATGAATQNAEGDLLLAEFSVSGGYALPVFCPTCPQDAYEITVRTVNCAEALRMPAILLTEKEVTMTYETVDLHTLPRLDIVDRPRFSDGRPYLTYGYEDLCSIPPFSPVGGPRKVTVTGSTHDRAGELRKDEPEVLGVLRHLHAKVAERSEELSVVSEDWQDGAETLVVSYGVTDRAARFAVREARRQGKRVSHLTCFSLFPLPERALSNAAAGVERVVVPEENIQGLYRGQLTGVLGEVPFVGVNKVGTLITPEEILREIR